MPYLARDPSLNRPVAIKVVPDSLAHDADHLTRFEREAVLLAALSHPNIAVIYALETLGATGKRRQPCSLAGRHVNGVHIR